MAHFVIIGGSDAGISAALRIRELDSRVGISVIVADAYPGFSICGLPFFLSGEVSDWQTLAHHTAEELEMQDILLNGLIQIQLQILLFLKIFLILV